MALTSKEPADILDAIKSLKHGESVVYYTGMTGWIGGAQYSGLRKWVNKAETQEKYDFVQRRINEDEFEYIAMRRGE